MGQRRLEQGRREGATEREYEEAGGHASVEVCARCRDVDQILIKGEISKDSASFVGGGRIGCRFAL